MSDNTSKKITNKLFRVIIEVVIIIIILLMLIGKVNIIQLFENLFMLKYLPQLNEKTSYGIILIFGLLTSFHCVGMCGGLAISQSVRKNEEDKKSYSFLRPSVFYQIGRVISYTLIGGIVGGLGQILKLPGKWSAVIPITGGIFMIIMSINLVGSVPFLRRFNITMPSFIAKKIYKKNNYSPLIIGLLSGLMPCGPLQIVQLYALSTRSIMIGATTLLIFALGTVPILLIFGVINSVLNKKYSNIILKTSAVLIFILGIVMIGRGLTLTGMSITNMSDCPNSNIVVIKGDNQSITTTIEANSYPEIVVVKDIPVKWTIKVDEEKLNDCNNAIQIPKYNIEKKLEVGDNIVEFTPKETGEIPYNCWMGMIKSKIIVVDSTDDVS